MKLQYVSLLAAISFSFAVPPLSAQWVETNGPFNPFTAGRCTVTGLASDSAGLFAATVGVYCTTDSGILWQRASAGLTTNAIESVASDGHYLFAGAAGGMGVFRSSDNGASWARVDSGFTLGDVGPFAFLDSATFFGSNGVYKSTDHGVTWSRAGLSNYGVYALAVKGTELFAGTYDSVYRSTDQGLSWTGLNMDLYGYQIPYFGKPALAVSGQNIFAGSPLGVHLSTDDGNTWSVVVNSYR